ncbi:hypothetical protein OG329_14020 [Streptomyces sp. NBC_01506]
MAKLLAHHVGAADYYAQRSFKNGGLDFSLLEGVNPVHAKHLLEQIIIRPTLAGLDVTHLVLRALELRRSQLLSLETGPHPKAPQLVTEIPKEGKRVDVDAR